MYVITKFSVKLIDVCTIIGFCIVPKGTSGNLRSYVLATILTLSLLVYVLLIYLTKRCTIYKFVKSMLFVLRCNSLCFCIISQYSLSSYAHISSSLLQASTYHFTQLFKPGHDFSSTVFSISCLIVKIGMVLLVSLTSETVL